MFQNFCVIRRNKTLLLYILASYNFNLHTRYRRFRLLQKIIKFSMKLSVKNFLQNIFRFFFFKLLNPDILTFANLYHEILANSV